MELVLIRHGEASLHARTDRERALTEHGERQAVAAAQWLAPQWQPDALLVSPFPRAQQTAAAFLALMPELRQESAEFLTPDTPLTTLNEQLETVSANRLLVIGHNPLFSNAITWFCGDDLREVMAPASMACIELPLIARDSGRLRWLRHAPDYSRIARCQ